MYHPAPPQAVHTSAMIQLCSTIHQCIIQLPWKFCISIHQCTSQCLRIFCYLVPLECNHVYNNVWASVIGILLQCMSWLQGKSSQMGSPPHYAVLWLYHLHQVQITPCSPGLRRSIDLDSDSEPVHYWLQRFLSHSPLSVADHCKPTLCTHESRWIPNAHYGNHQDPVHYVGPWIVISNLTNMLIVCYAYLCLSPAKNTNGCALCDFTILYVLKPT